ncbi:MAG: 4Fe-4S dicluster domain-containing protein [Bacillota bacterium]|nr:4Fe-4S dicluster domain-containing protein [Bacillota bacterium]
MSEVFEMLRVLSANLGRGPATRRYPAEKRAIFPSSRGRIESVIENCIFCGVCQKRCPADCIVVNKAERTWNLDPYQCIVCGVCVEVCPTKAIAMRTEYRKPRSERTPLTHHQEPGPREGRVEG